MAKKHIKQRGKKKHKQNKTKAKLERRTKISWIKTGMGDRVMKIRRRKKTEGERGALKS